MARKCKCRPCVGTIEIDASSPDCDTADLEQGDRYTQNDILFEVNGGTGITVTSVKWTLITGAATVIADTGATMTASVGGFVDFAQPNAILWDADPIRATAAIEYVCDATGATHWAIVPHAVAACSGGNTPLVHDTEDDCCIECDLASLISSLIPEACHDKLIWFIDPETPRGFTYETWTDGDESGVGNPNTDQAAFEQAWSGAPVDGIPTHVNGQPTLTGVEGDTRFAQSERAQDEHRLCYWFHNDRPVPIEIQDSDARAESLRIYASCDCPATLIYERYQSEGAPYDSDSQTIATIPPGGLVKWTVLIHDPGPDFSGFRPQANEVGDTALFEPTSYQRRPVVDCKVVKQTRCGEYQLAEGESEKPIPMECLDCGGADGGLSEEDVLALIPDPIVPSTLAPVPDNEVDASIRTGQAGTTGQFSDAGHNHPIRRQANPGDPTIVQGGNMTLLASLILDRWSTEETFEYRFRVQVEQQAGTGWGWVTIPTIAGFQQPQILDVGSYRLGLNLVQQDDDGSAGNVGGLGAAPRGPYMGKECHHWSSTNRVYGGFNRRDNAHNSFYEFTVRYIRS